MTVLTSPWGSLTTLGTQFQVRDSGGDYLAGTPLTERPLAAGTPPPEANEAAQPTTVEISPPELPGYRYTADERDYSVHLETPFATLTSHGSRYEIRNERGDLVAAAPPTSRPDHPAYPPSAPDPLDPVMPAAIGPLVNADATTDFESAPGVAGTEFASAVGIGGMVGGLTGIPVGCVLGAIAGTALAPFVFGPDFVVGCIVGAMYGLAFGTGSARRFSASRSVLPLASRCTTPWCRRAISRRPDHSRRNRSRPQPNLRRNEPVTSPESEYPGNRRIPAARSAYPSLPR